jgi:hypothetical protein
MQTTFSIFPPNVSIGQLKTKLPSSLNQSQALSFAGPHDSFQKKQPCFGASFGDAVAFPTDSLATPSYLWGAQKSLFEFLREHPDSAPVTIEAHLSGEGFSSSASQACQNLMRTLSENNHSYTVESSSANTRGGSSAGGHGRSTTYRLQRTIIMK